MEISWTNTGSALQDFASVLVCGKCGFKLVSPVRLTNCGHLFCQDCIKSAMKCVKCDVPVQPREIQSDHLVSGLIQNIDAISEIIHKRDIWDTTTDAPGTSDKTISSVFLTPKKQGIRRKNINKPNPKGETRLHTACLKNNIKEVRELLVQGAIPDTKDHAGWTPLQEVVSFGLTEICELLLEWRASPDISGYNNRKPLHEAAKHNKIKEAKLLLRYNADRNQYDQYGKKPIDYCKTEEMRQLLTDLSTPAEEVSNLNQTLNKSIRTGCDKFVILASNLKHENQKMLGIVAARHKFKILKTYRPLVTHVIVETNEKNNTTLTLDVLFAIIYGSWLLNSLWIHMMADVDEIEDTDDMNLELFEVSGVPTDGTPKKSRMNTERCNPRLFNNCFFYFALQANTTYHIADVRVTKDDLIRLVKEGEGTVLTREPDPEDLDVTSQTMPFHANDPSHPLRKCTHYIIYVPGKSEPLIKYKMPHIKTLPLVWLIECIEKFTLVDPAILGLS
ncbi:PREDICTED: BRCA1-associated RING domain protein 1-like [Wasmannia auropunctata]|uniref:BRCA1-associated RING domain protein 1-like n=1 Tax=Wasmannia auropunctata TaxID=64793 RepID=UPI0005EF0115|nr:PREDICTED: BRCA1-associated RING domain protein 1-like [Wasmannia auropunctata]